MRLYRPSLPEGRWWRWRSSAPHTPNQAHQDKSAHLLMSPCSSWNIWKNGELERMMFAHLCCLRWLAHVKGAHRAVGARVLAQAAGAKDSLMKRGEFEGSKDAQDTIALQNCRQFEWQKWPLFQTVPLPKVWGATYMVLWSLLTQDVSWSRHNDCISVTYIKSSIDSAIEPPKLLLRTEVMRAAIWDLPKQFSYCDHHNFCSKHANLDVNSWKCSLNNILSDPRSM